MSEEKKDTSLTTRETALAIVPLSQEIQIPPEIQAAMPPEKYIGIVTKGDYASIYGTPLEGPFLFMHAMRKGYNPWNSPFQFILVPQKNGPAKATLYAKKEAATQKKSLQGWTVRIVYQGLLRLTYKPVVLKDEKGAERVELVPDTFDGKFYEVVSDVFDAGGIFLEREVGVYPMGEDRTPTMAYTRSKRRAILAASGESSNDESEFDTPPMPQPSGAPQRRVPAPEPPSKPPAPAPVKAAEAVVVSGELVNTKTGEVIGQAPTEAPSASEEPQKASSAPSQAPEKPIVPSGLPPLPKMKGPSKPPNGGK